MGIGGEVLALGFGTRCSWSCRVDLQVPGGIRFGMKCCWQRNGFVSPMNGLLSIINEAVIGRPKDLVWI